MEQALYLLNECDLPLKVVMKRMKLNRGLLERLKKRGRADPDLFVKLSAKGKRFKKIHDRAREMIKSQL